MATLYKLTNRYWYTHNKTRWGPGVTHCADTTRPALMCTGSVIHAYTSPLLALIFNPIHGNFYMPVLWAAEGDVVLDDGSKCACRSLTTTHIINEVTEYSLRQLAAFAVLCAREVYTKPVFTQWADDWLGGKDTAPETVAVVYKAAMDDFVALRRSSSNDATANQLATGEQMATAAENAIRVAFLNGDTKVCAPRAACAAKEAKADLDLHSIAEQALKY